MHPVFAFGLHFNWYEAILFDLIFFSPLYITAWLVIVWLSNKYFAMNGIVPPPKHYAPITLVIVIALFFVIINAIRSST